MKKTLLVTLDYPPMVGGVAHYYHNLINQLPDGDVFVLDNSKEELLSTSKLLWPKWLPAVLNTYRAIKKYNFEHILVGQILPLGTVALLMKLFKRIPYTVMTHAMDVTTPLGAEGNGRKRWLMEKILKHAYRVTTVSRFTRERLHELGVPSKRIVTVYPCPHLDGTHAVPTKENLDTLDNTYDLHDKRVILSVGRLVQRKGFDATIDAFAQLADDHKNAVYVVVGDGPYKENLQKIADSLGVADRVRFVGRVNDDQLSHWYQRCELFLMPSRELENKDVEGFGIVFLEANSYGKPVIGGKSGGIADAVVDGETGYLVDPTDTAMIAKAIDRLLSNESAAIKLGHQGYKRVQDIFQWDRQAKKIEEFLS